MLDEKDLFIEVDNVIENYNNAKKEMIKKSKEKFLEITTKIFEAFPKLESFGWQEFTQYFNDGETCNFHVHSYSECIKINGYRYEYDDKPENNTSILTEDENCEISEVISKFLNKFPTDMYLDTFGDHVEITIYRDGKIDIEEYTDHD